MFTRSALAAAIICLLALVPSNADADDCANKTTENASPLKTVVIGSLMAIPTYLLGVTWHEGSHAVAVEALGYDVTEFSILPRFHPLDGHLTFGHTSYNKFKICGPILGLCRMSPGEEAFILFAPKITDLTMMGVYSLLNETNRLPENYYARVALTSVAVGAWVDFSKDVLASSKYNDVNASYRLLGEDAHSWSNPYRLAYVGLIGASGVAVGRGVYKLLTNSGGNHKAPAPEKPRTSMLLTPDLVGVEGTF